MRPLTKREVEALLRDDDGDPIDALTTALRIVLGRDGDWEALIRSIPTSLLPPDRREALLARDVAALDELLAELNETRGRTFYQAMTPRSLDGPGATPSPNLGLDLGLDPGLDLGLNPGLNSRADPDRDEGPQL